MIYTEMINYIFALIAIILGWVAIGFYIYECKLGKVLAKKKYFLTMVLPQYVNGIKADLNDSINSLNLEPEKLELFNELVLNYSLFSFNKEDYKTIIIENRTLMYTDNSFYSIERAILNRITEYLSLPKYEGIKNICIACGDAVSGYASKRMANSGDTSSQIIDAIKAYNVMKLNILG